MEQAWKEHATPVYIPLAGAGSNGHIQLQGRLGSTVYFYSQEEELASFCYNDQEVRKCTVGCGVGNETKP